MNIFKSNNKKKNSGKLKFGENKFINKKRLLPFVAVFGLLGGYLVYRSFAYSPYLDGNDGKFVSMSPTRILDTRNGVGGFTQPIGAQGEYTVDIVGQGNIPSSVSSVVINVVAIKPTADTYLTVYPSGESRPNASSLNASAGQVIANQITAKVGTDGKVKIYNNAGNTNVIFDVAGYFSTKDGPSGARFVTVSPTRILDTRNGVGGFTQPIGAQGEYTVDIVGQGNIPSSVSSVVINVVAIKPTADTYLTVYPSGESRPNASSLNASAGQVIANQITAKVGTDGKVKIYNNAGNTNVIFDVAGYYEYEFPGEEKAQDGRYVSLSPTRILDTRTGVGGFTQPIGAKGEYTISIFNKGGVPNSVSSVVINVVAIKPTANTFLTVYPSGESRPVASSLNASAGQVIANQITAKVGADGKVKVYNEAGNTNVIFDVAGYYISSDANFGGGATVRVDPDLYSPASVSRIEQTIDIKTLQSKNTGAFIDVSVDDHPGYPTWTRMYLDQGKYTITCYPQSVKLCSSLSSSASVVNGEDSTTIEIPATFTTGKYKFTYEVVDNQANLPGRWLKITVVTPLGETLPLYAEKRVDLLSNLGVYVSLMQQSIDCKNPRLIEVAVGNITYDGVAQNVSSQRETDWRGGVCKGISQTVFKPGLSDQADLYLMRVGIPRSQRDLTPPTASLVWDANTSTWTLKAQDDVSVAAFLDKQVNTYYQLHGNVVSTEGHYYAGMYGLKEGDNLVSFEVEDTSGNTTTIEQVINGVVTPPWLQPVQ